MFQAAASAVSSRAQVRAPSLVQGLTVSIPARAVLATALEQLNNRDKNKDTTITFSSLLLSQQDIRSIVDAFYHVENNSKITLVVRELFVNPRSENPDNLLKFWNAIKGKVQKINWEGNKFHKTFQNFLSKDIAENPNVTAQSEFFHTDITDSSIQANSRTPSSSHSLSQSPSMSPSIHSSPQFLGGFSLFSPVAEAAAAMRSSPSLLRQVSAP